MGLRDAHRIVPVTAFLKLLDLGANLRIRGNVRSTIDLRGDRFHLFPERRRLFVYVFEVGGLVFDDIDDCARDLLRALSAFGPMPRQDDGNIVMRHLLLEQRHLRIRVEAELVDRDHAWQPIVVAYVVHVALEVRDSLFQGIEVFLVELLYIDATVILERA